MGKKTKRSRAASFQLEEDAEDPLKRLQAFRERLFDPKAEEASARLSTAAGSSSAGDGVPAVQWKAGKKSKARKKQRLVEDAADEDVVVPTVKFSSASSKKKDKQKKDRSVTTTRLERPKVVQIPGQAPQRVALAAAVGTASTVSQLLTKKKKQQQKKLKQVQSGGPEAKVEGAAKGPKRVVKPTTVVAFNDPAAKPFQEDADPLADVMRSVQLKMEAESAKRAKLMAFTAAMSASRAKAEPPDSNKKSSKKKSKKRKADVEGGNDAGETTVSLASASIAGVPDNTADVEAAPAPAAAVVVQSKTKKSKTKKSKTADESCGRVFQRSHTKNTSGADAHAGASTADATEAPEAPAVTVSSSPKKTKERVKNRAKKLYAQQLHLKQESVCIEPPSPMALVSKSVKGAEAGGQDKSPTTNGKPSVSTTPLIEQEGAKFGAVKTPIQEQENSKVEKHHKKKKKKKKKELQPSTQQKHLETQTPTETTEKPAVKSSAQPAKPVDTLASPASDEAIRPMRTVKPKNPFISDSDSSEGSDSDCDSGVPSREKRTAASRADDSLERSEWGDDDVAGDSDASTSSLDDEVDAGIAGTGRQFQRQLFSALIDEAARETWELAEVGRLVRLFSSFGWARRPHETATFLRHYCAELVSAEFLDGLGVTLSSKQLLSIFDRGSGQPEVFVNKVASAVENHYLRAKDPAVADALEKKVDALADPSTRGICAFLLPLLESLSTVRDVGALLRRLCRHWQPERAASLVQHVLLTSVFDDLEGDQDEMLAYMPQLEGLLDFPSRMAHEDADEDGNLIGLIASDDEGDVKDEDERGSDAEGEDEDDPEAALGEVLSDEEDEDEEDEEEYEGETDSEEEREAAIRYGPDRRQRRRSRFVLDEADESEEEEDSEEDGEEGEDERGWHELVGSGSDDE